MAGTSGASGGVAYGSILGGCHLRAVPGRLDAVLIAARVALLTRRIGMMPTVVVTHTEPFHLSKAIGTLDYVSAGRAGVRVSASPAEAVHFGRRDVTAFTQGDGSTRRETPRR